MPTALDGGSLSAPRIEKFRITRSKAASDTGLKWKAGYQFW
jgi:hypothetical protein